MRGARIIPLLPMLFLLFRSAPAQLSVTSPDGVNTISFRLHSGGLPQWQLTRHGKVLLDWSSLGLTFRQTGPMSSHLAMVERGVLGHDEPYQLVTGKAKTARDRYRGPTDVAAEKAVVTAGDILPVHLAKGGGMVARLRKE